MDIKIEPIRSFSKTLTVPGDKSITQRAILFSSLLAEKEVVINNALLGEDCLSCIDCVKKLGAKVEIKGDTVIVKGVTKLNSAELFVGNSGTAFRLLMGILSGQAGKRFILDGDSSIRSRPMDRVIIPLQKMGASVASLSGFAPVAIEGSRLNGVEYNSPIASAQVKSAILLAGLFSDKETTVTEPRKSRDHTERMLKYFGVPVLEDGNSVTVRKSKIVPKDVSVAGDISSAAFPLVLAAAKEKSSVKVCSVGLNSTRDGILRLLNKIGADIKIEKTIDYFEPYGDIILKQKPLKPFLIDGDLVPLLIDEIPILAVLACFINGVSTIKGAKELKVKETNRIDTTVNALKKMGADIKATDDGMIINGGFGLEGGVEIWSHSDHRIAMSMAIAAALSKKGATIKNAECAFVSYPNFYSILQGENV